MVCRIQVSEMILNLARTYSLGEGADGAKSLGILTHRDYAEVTLHFHLDSPAEGIFKF